MLFVKVLCDFVTVIEFHDLIPFIIQNDPFISGRRIRAFPLDERQFPTADKKVVMGEVLFCIALILLRLFCR